MKKIIFLFLAIPFLGIGQSKNIVSTNRVFPKVDKVLEFEKALTAHAQKYHTGDWKWRVFEIQTGRDAGGYQITEGPLSWDQIDGRGNLGVEHNNDWNKTVTIYLTDKSSNSFYAYQDSLSTAKLTDWSDKIAITHWVQKVGYGNKVRENIRKMKAAWETGGETIAVYTASSSGPAEYTMVYRYKQGLKERNSGFRTDFKDRYEAVHGEDSFEGFLGFLQNYLSEQWSEMLFYRADLSSK